MTAGDGAGAQATRSHDVEVAGIATHYLEAGPPDGDVVVLVHDGAFGADGSVTWVGFLEELATDHHVYSPDMLGYGRTQKVYDFGAGGRSQRIRHLARWMDAVGIESCHVVGNSMGGGLILEAARKRAWPIRAAVDITGTGGFMRIEENYRPLIDYTPDRGRMRALVELMLHRRDRVMEELVERRYELSTIRGHWEALAAPRLRPPVDGPKRPPPDEGAFLAGLEAIDCPVLMVEGAEDILLDDGWARRMAAHVRRGAVLTVGGAAHQPQIDQPEHVAAEIRKFLESAGNRG